MSVEPQIRSHAAFVWSVADKLRGVYKQSEYGRVILPLVVLRRLDCVLEPTKADVLARAETLKGKVENVAPVLEAVAGERFFNRSPLDFRRLLDDPANVAGNLRSYIAGFSPAARDVIEKFGFDAQITRLARANLLYLVVSQFAEVDLHPHAVSNVEMGYLYEELIRKFSELSNETAGEHFTPREVIRLMVNLLFVEDDDVLQRRGIVKTLFDPACGTGGMLSVAEDYLRELNPDARLEVFGQELNEETYAVCRSDMMLKGQDASHIVQGNSFDADGHADRTFDYMLANPPFGVEWKPVERFVKDERERLGFRGRFGAGLPAINDGSFLFLQHMISKMKPPTGGGSRLAIVFNGSPLFTGAAGSGPSEIRRWIVENDWLEAVVALPDQLFYNTGISTYFWVVTNRKSSQRRGKVQLVDARELWVKMRKSLGEKRKAISDAQIAEITRLYGAFEEGERVKIFRNEQFGYQRITVERPLRLRYAGEGARERLEGSKAFAKLGDERQEALLGVVGALSSLATTDRAEALAAATAADGKLSKKDEKTLLEALALRDPEAPALDEPDPELRDQENVPLPNEPVSFEPDPSERLASDPYRRAADEYMATEVFPYVPDAWVDHRKTKIGYEIPLTRQFYRHIPPRPLDDIDGEITSAARTVSRLLEAVVARDAGAISSSETDTGDALSVGSSLPWLMRRPSHWAEVKLTLIAKLGSGHTPSRDRPEWWEGASIPWITTADVAAMRGDRIEFIEDTVHKISELGLANSAAELHPAGTVVLSRTASVGFSAIMARPMATSQDFATWTCGPRLRPRYLLLCLRAMRRDLVGRLAMGSTHKTIYMPDIAGIRIPLPSLVEQDAIVNWASNRLQVVDDLTDRLLHELQLLAEHRDATLLDSFACGFPESPGPQETDGATALDVV